jgi:hypothetical protein
MTTARTSDSRDLRLTGGGLTAHATVRPARKRTRRAGISLLGLLLASAGLMQAATQSSVLTSEPDRRAPIPRLGAETLTIQSEVLGESRRMYVATPSSFTATTRRYPVVIVLDGEARFAPAVTATAALTEAGHMPEALVVGVENTNRLRDYSPPGLHVSGNEGRGRGDRFLDFQDLELRPALVRQFRASDLVVLIGHSSGGILATWAAAERPANYRWIVALDTPLHLDGFWLEDRLIARATASPSSPLRFVSVEARFGWPDDGWTRFVGRVPDDWRLHRMRTSGESHESMVAPAMYDGLKALFADYSIVTSEGTTAAERLSNFDRAARDYGNTPPPRPLLHELIEDQILERQLEGARETLTRLRDAYGDSPEIARVQARIEAAGGDELEGPTLAILRATPRATAAEIAPFVGEWTGAVRNEGSTTDKPLTLRLRVENGVAAGAFVFPDGARHALDYVALVGGALHVGYMNGMRPRGMLMYEGTVDGDVFEGRFVLRGVVFRLPDGRTIPEARFRLARQSHP